MGGGGTRSRLRGSPYPQAPRGLWWGDASGILGVPRCPEGAGGASASSGTGAAPSCDGSTWGWRRRHAKATQRRTEAKDAYHCRKRKQQENSWGRQTPRPKQPNIRQCCDGPFHEQAIPTIDHTGVTQYRHSRQPKKQERKHACEHTTKPNTAQQNIYSDEYVRNDILPFVR